MRKDWGNWKLFTQTHQNGLRFILYDLCLVFIWFSLGFGIGDGEKNFFFFSRLRLHVLVWFLFWPILCLQFLCSIWSPPSVLLLFWFRLLSLFFYYYWFKTFYFSNSEILQHVMICCETRIKNYLTQ